MTSKTFGSITVADGHYQVTAPPQVMTRLKRLFPRARPHRAGHLELSVTPETSADLEWVTDRYPMTMSVDTAAAIADGAARHRATEQAVHDVLTGTRHLHLPLTPARPPRPYQEAPVQIVWETGSLLLADFLGLGKSYSSLMTFANPESLPALVVTLTHLPTQWQRELEATWPHLTSTILTKGTPYPLVVNGRDPDVIITNYHKLAGWADHLAGRVNTVIFDECQELRREGSQKYVAAAQIADKAKFRWGLSATPIFNYGDEIWSVLNVISPDTLGSKQEFRREWCNDGNRISDPEGLGQYLRDSGTMLRRTRKDVGRDLPGDKPIRIVHSIDIDNDIYDNEAGDVAAALAEKILAGGHREAFLSAGELDWRLRQATGIAKAKFVADFVGLLAESEPVVLFGWHRACYTVWMERLERLGLNPVMYTGSESPTQKQRAFEQFRDGESKVMLMSLRAGAGLDGLQEVSHVCVFGELDWSPGVHDQGIGRLFRDGQTEPTVAYFLVADSGSDPVMADVLNLKRGSSEPLIDPGERGVVESIDPDHIRRLAQDFLDRRRGGGRLL